MKRIFGAAKLAAAPKEAPTLGQASEKIDGQMQDLDAKIKKCDAELKECLAKGGRNGPAKNRALMVLKRKKMIEQQRDQLMNTQFNVDSLAFAHEQAQNTAQTVEAMKASTEALKAQYANMNIGDIEKMSDDIQDLMFDQEEINDLLSRAYTVPDGFDEADLDAEYEALEAEIALDQMSGSTAPTGMPAYLPSSSPAESAAASASAEQQP